MPAARLSAGVCVLAAALAIACGGGEPPDRTLDAAAGRAVSVELQDIAFSALVLEAAVDEVVELQLRNVGSVAHDFTIERIDAHSNIQGARAAGHEAHSGRYAVHAAADPGASVALRLHLHEPGKYAYFCTVPGHREAGMSGTLVVG
jgi:uncharacterized cupredoxin-like copper-binding protein